MSYADPADPESTSVNRGGLCLVDDRPGTLIKLAWTGRQPYGWWRSCGPLLGLVLLILPGVGERGPWMTGWKLLRDPAPWQPETYAILAMALVGGLYLLWTLGHILGKVFGYWNELSFDATEQLLTIRRHGWLIWGYRTLSIPFTALRAVALHVGPEDRGPFPLELVVRYAERADEQRWSALLHVLSCQRRDAAFEFLMSIARVLEAKGYSRGEESRQRASWHLVLPFQQPPEPELTDDEDEDEDNDGNEGETEQDDDVLPIPLTAERDQQLGQSSGPRPQPVNQQLAAKVDPDQLAGKITFTRLEVWQPGERVLIVRRPAPAVVFIIVALVGVAGGAAIAGWPLFAFAERAVGRGTIWWPGALLWGSMTGGTLLSFFAWNQFRQQSVDIDWQNSVITFHSAVEHRASSLADVRSIAISGIQENVYESSEDDDQPARVVGVKYGCRVDLILADRDVPLIATEQWEEDSQAARNLLQPLATSLAQALGVSCKWEPQFRFDHPELRQVVRLTRSQWVIAGGLLLIAIAGLGVANHKEQVRRQAGQTIRDLGGDVAWMTRKSVKHLEVARDYWNVRFRNAADIDEKLTRLRPALTGIAALGIDIEDSPLTDRGLQQLAGTNGLKVLDLTGTKVTDDGLAALQDCSQLRYLNLFGTRITDRGLPQLQKMRQLRFLYLGGTDVTDDGLRHLTSLPALEYLQLTGSRVTIDGVRILKQAFPRLDVDFHGN